jgi:hypothetical protein
MILATIATLLALAALFLLWLGTALRTRMDAIEARDARRLAQSDADFDDGSTTYWLGGQEIGRLDYLERTRRWAA